MENKVIYGNSLLELPKFQDRSIPMVFTSPPYADRRKKCYDSIPEEQYVEWFLPFAYEIKRVLTKEGSFFLNIKPHSKDGKRSLYVMDLVLALTREVGFNLIEEYCWTKMPFPGDLKGRFKNAFEPVYHFSVGPANKLTFHPLACGTPIKMSTMSRNKRQKHNGGPANGSNMAGWSTDSYDTLTLSRPSNVIHANNVSNQHGQKKKHPATFPVELPEFFIKSFSNEGDIILDPFAGSGTTGVAAAKNRRRYVMIENQAKYIPLIHRRLSETQILLY